MVKYLICNGCEYHWTYRGESDYYACCPRCRSSVKIDKNEVLEAPEKKKESLMQKAKGMFNKNKKLTRVMDDEK